MLLGSAEISWLLAMIFPPPACFRAFPGQPSSRFHGSPAQGSMASVRDREVCCSWSDSSSSRRMSRRDVQSHFPRAPSAAVKNQSEARSVSAGCWLLPRAALLPVSTRNQVPRPVESSPQTSLSAVSCCHPSPSGLALTQPSSSLFRAMAEDARALSLTHLAALHAASGAIALIPEMKISPCTISLLKIVWPLQAASQKHCIPRLLAANKK